MIQVAYKRIHLHRTFRWKDLLSCPVSSGAPVGFILFVTVQLYIISSCFVTFSINKIWLFHSLLSPLLVHLKVVSCGFPISYGQDTLSSDPATVSVLFKLWILGGSVIVFMIQNLNRNLEHKSELHWKAQLDCLYMYIILIYTKGIICSEHMFMTVFF